MADDKKLTSAEKEKLNKLTLEELKLMKEKAPLHEKELAYVNSILASRRSSLEVINQRKLAAAEEVAHLEQILEGETNRTVKLEAQRLLKEAQEEQSRVELQLIQEKLRLGEEITEEEEKQLKASQKRIKQQESENKHLEAAKGLAQDIGSIWGKVSKDFGAHPFFNVTNLKKFGSAFKQPKEFFKNLGTAALTSFVDSMIGLAFSLDQARTDFIRSTGATEEYQKAMQASYEANRKFGASIEDNVKAHTALRQSFTDFTMLTPQLTTELGNNAAMLKKWGNISEESFAKSMQAANKFMGQAPLEAASTTREIAALAKDIGVEPAKLVEQFGAMGPSLAKFGKQGEKAFKDLARVSKITGLEIEKLISITSKFDTFEGAAEQAGMLNAALGTNMVNAMDLMMETDPAARFDMLRDSILDAGLSFDDMSYYQKQFYTNSLGLESVGDLALMLGGNMDALGGDIGKTSSDYEEMAEQTKQIQSLQESFNAMLADLVPILTPIIESVRQWLLELRSNEERLESIKNTLQNFANMLIFVFDNFLPLLGLWILGPAILGPLAAGLASAAGALITMGSSSVAAGKGAAIGGNLAQIGAGGMLAFGLAALMVGIALGGVILSFALLVREMGKLPPARILATGAAFLMLSGGIYALAMALAAAGNPFSMAGLAVIGGVSAAIGGISWAISKFFETDYSEMTEVLNAVGSAGGSSSDVEKMFEGIAKAIDKVDIDEIEALEKLLRSLNSAGTNAGPISNLMDTVFQKLGIGAPSGKGSHGAGATSFPEKVTINLVGADGAVQQTTGELSFETAFGTLTKALTLF